MKSELKCWGGQKNEFSFENVTFMSESCLIRNRPVV